MTAPFSITLPVDPIAKGRPRVGKGGHVFTPKRTKNAESEITRILRSGNPPMFEGPVCVEAVFIVKRPQRLKGTGRVYVTARPDLDNYFKLLCDAMNGVLFEDDSQIVSAHIWKMYGNAGEPGSIVLKVGKVAA